MFFSLTSNPLINGGVCNFSNSTSTLALPLFSNHSSVKFVVNEASFICLYSPFSSCVTSKVRVPKTCHTLTCLTLKTFVFNVTPSILEV